VSTAEALRRIVGRLDAARIPYLVTGSFASSAHGIRRTTFDFDFVVDPDEEPLRAFVRGLPSDEYYVDESTAVDALRRRSMFNVVDQTTQWKFDLIVCKRDEFARSQFDRRVRISVVGVEVWVASAEDVIVSKLQWARAGGSERQLRDVAGVVAVQGDSLDRGYVESWVKRLGVEDLWRQVLDELPPG
jgi:hypothetical protein